MFILENNFLHFNSREFDDSNDEFGSFGLNIIQKFLPWDFRNGVCHCFTTMIKLLNDSKNEFSREKTTVYKFRLDS